MSRIHIKCNPSENSIYGLYTPGDTVLILCDATDGDFTIKMPDSFSSEDTEFNFSKVDSSLNIVRIEAIENQTIMSDEYQELSECGDLLELHSDGDGNWW
jgi:hypothetical protein